MRMTDDRWLAETIGTHSGKATEGLINSRVCLAVKLRTCFNCPTVGGVRR